MLNIQLNRSYSNDVNVTTNENSVCVKLRYSSIVIYGPCTVSILHGILIAYSTSDVLKIDSDTIRASICKGSSLVLNETCLCKSIINILSDNAHVTFTDCYMHGFSLMVPRDASGDIIFRNCIIKPSDYDVPMTITSSCNYDQSLIEFDEDMNVCLTDLQSMCEMSHLNTSFINNELKHIIENAIRQNKSENMIVAMIERYNKSHNVTCTQGMKKSIRKTIENYKQSSSDANSKSFFVILYEEDDYDHWGDGKLIDTLTYNDCKCMINIPKYVNLLIKNIDYMKIINKNIVVLSSNRSIIADSFINIEQGSTLIMTYKTLCNVVIPIEITENGVSRMTNYHSSFNITNNSIVAISAKIRRTKINSKGLTLRNGTYYVNGASFLNNSCELYSEYDSSLLNVVNKLITKIDLNKIIVNDVNAGKVVIKQSHQKIKRSSSVKHEQSSSRALQDISKQIEQSSSANIKQIPLEDIERSSFAESERSSSVKHEQISFAEHEHMTTLRVPIKSFYEIISNELGISNTNSVNITNIIDVMLLDQDVYETLYEILSVYVEDGTVVFVQDINIKYKISKKYIYISKPTN